MGIPGLTPFAQKAVPLSQQTVAAASIGASYSLVGAKFSDPPLILILVSTLDQAVQLSLDGINDWIPMPALGTVIIDIKANGLGFPGEYGVYVKRIGTPASGVLYVSGVTVL